MHLKPKHVMLIVVTVLVGAGIFFVLNADLPGSREQSGDVITKTIASVQSDATASFSITLREGDAEHEADHIFEALQSPAIESASFNMTTLELGVDYDSSQIDEQAIRQLLVNSGYVQITAADAVPATMSEDGTSQEVTVNVGQALDPAIISARAGVPLKIVFGEGTNHLASISISELGIQQDLSNGGATVEIPDPQPGMYGIVCAEGVVDGRLIVE